MVGSVFREFWPDIKQVLTGKGEREDRIPAPGAGHRDGTDIEDNR